MDIYRTVRYQRQPSAFPYLPGNIDANAVNVSWAANITYPMAQGFGYLVTIIDVFSHRIISWRLSNTLDTGFCIQALRRYGKPAVFYWDQRRQFNSRRCTQVLKDAGVRICMDDRGAWRVPCWSKDSGGH